MSTVVRTGSAAWASPRFTDATIEANSLCVAFGLALERRTDISASMTGLLRLLQGDFLRIVRYPHGNRHRPSILFATVSPVSRWLVAPTADSLTNPLIAEMARRPRAGTIWSLDDIPDSDLSNPDSLWHKLSMRYGFADVVTLALESTKDHSDVIEVFCRTRQRDAPPVTSKLFGIAAPILASLWGQRSPGVELGLWKGLEPNETVTDSRITALSCDNPLGLTRSEFRICERIVRGLSVKRIASDLEISPHTVRSHLRNIFAKTGTDNQRTLLVRLLELDLEKRADAAISA